MEPPAKRMRIWQSVEVDEENIEYIKAKQKQQQKFKSRLESIFEKYGNMHESMSDEIDMKTNQVVVDRGHLRRLKRQVGRKEIMLLDTLGLAVEKESEHGSEEEENAEDSEDELAPTQPKNPSDGQLELDGPRPQASDNHGQSPHSDKIPSVPQEANTPANSLPHFGAIQTPSRPNATPNLLPLVQFPQTPAGQQAQTTFYMTLTQGIGEVIQKAMIQSGLLPPSFPTPFANGAPLPTTPITAADRIAPATDPKWFFPPLSAAARQHSVAQSSPLPTNVAPPTEQVDQAIGTALPYELEGQVVAGSTPVVNETSPMVSCAMLQDSSPTRCRRTSPYVEIQKRRIPPARKYHFTPEDDVYISKRRMVDRMSWAAIKKSQNKWKDWSVSTLSRRWAVIKDQNLHLQTPILARSCGDGHDVRHELEEKVQAPPTKSHHLPTPSSSEHEESQMEIVEPTEKANEFPSGAYFDDDERELLSLAGTDVEEDHLSSDEEAPDPVSEDSIIPSIETTDSPAVAMSGFIDEADLQRELLDSLPMQDATVTPIRGVSPQVKMEPASPSPIITQGEDQLTRRFETVPDFDSRDEANDGTMQQPDTTSSLRCPICNRLFKTHQTLARHQANPRNTHTHPVPPRRRSVSLDLIADADILATDDDSLPTTTKAITIITATPPPPIKREPNTPSTSFFVSAFRTPKTTLHQHHGSSSCASGSLSKSTSKVDRRAHFKQLKRCWKGSGTPLALTSSTVKRKSVGALENKKRMKMSDGDSEERDELCF